MKKRQTIKNIKRVSCRFDIAYPVTRQFRQEMYEEIVKEFNAVMDKEGQQEETSNANEEQHTEG